MPGFYGYTYVGVWHRANPTLLLTCHGTQRALPSGRAKPDWSQQGQPCWLCGWAEQPQVTALCPSKASLAGRRELRVCLLLPSNSWDGVVQCNPFPYNSSCSWRSVLTSWTCWYSLNSERDGEVTNLFSWQRHSHGPPWAAPAHIRSKWNSITVKRMDLWGGTWTEARNFLCFIPGENTSPQSKIKDSTLQNNKCLLNMETKGQIQPSPKQKKPTQTPKTNPE